MRFIFLFLVMLLGGCQMENTAELQVPPVSEPIIEAPVVEVEQRPQVSLKPRFVIESIMGLAQDTLQNILGEPSLKRHERDVRVWMYRNEECVLHLYFYSNENGDFRLDYVEAGAVDLSADNPTVSSEACLDSHVVPAQLGK